MRMAFQKVINILINYQCKKAEDEHKYTYNPVVVRPTAIAKRSTQKFAS